MKKILVPVDFSKHSEYALEVAATLAKENDAEILVVHMMGLSEAIITKDDAQEMQEALFYMKLAKKRFDTFLDKEYLKGIEISETVQNYKIFSELNKVAQENDADLIVMGSHGTGGLNEVFVGSNTEKVVRTSDIPVLVIKEQRSNFKIKDMVFACDFKDDSLLVFRKAKSFAEKLRATLHLVFINTPADDFLSTGDAHKRISQFLQKTGVDTEVDIYNDYSVERGILNYCESHKANVVAVPTHGRKGLSHFFMGSIGEDIANHSKIPVLTFKI